MGHTFPPTLTLLSFKAGIEGPSGRLLSVDE